MQKRGSPLSIPPHFDKRGAIYATSIFLFGVTCDVIHYTTVLLLMMNDEAKTCCSEFLHDCVSKHPPHYTDNPFKSSQSAFSEFYLALLQPKSSVIWPWVSANSSACLVRSYRWRGTEFRRHFHRCNNRLDFGVHCLLPSRTKLSKWLYAMGRGRSFIVIFAIASYGNVIFCIERWKRQQSTG